MEAMVNDKFVDIGGSVQKIQASLCENQANTRENFLRIGESVLEIRTMIAGKKEPIGIKKDCKRGFCKPLSISIEPNGGSNLQGRLRSKSGSTSLSQGLLGNIELKYKSCLKADRLRGAGLLLFYGQNSSTSAMALWMKREIQDGGRVFSQVEQPYLCSA
uniref:Uncharacterized protein n=1 Tax=Ditylenchus dipsaci TaxID=166011 RepID=A0A915DW70_9BILA